jgi:hypothetical protein
VIILFSANYTKIISTKLLPINAPGIDALVSFRDPDNLIYIPRANKWVFGVQNIGLVIIYL